MQRRVVRYPAELLSRPQFSWRPQKPGRRYRQRTRRPLARILERLQQTSAIASVAQALWFAKLWGGI